MAQCPVGLLISPKMVEMNKSNANFNLVDGQTIMIIDICNSEKEGRYP